jgi:very-short-patch-repair endonuclease
MNRIRNSHYCHTALRDLDCGARLGASHLPVLGVDPIRRISAAQRFALARQLRRSPTPAERHAWSLLRNRGVLGLKFRRQHVLHGFIVDFYCLEQRLVLELEGDPHEAPARRGYDESRAALLRAGGYRVVRIRNSDVALTGLHKAIQSALAS